MRNDWSTRLLIGAIVVNYAAQVPYYLHQYYFPHHRSPSLVGVFLLSATLVWFVVGYHWYATRRRFGYAVLLGFLAAQILFYGHSIALGLLTGAGAAAQLRTPSLFLLVVFLLGYVNFAAASYYAIQMVRLRAKTGAS